MKHPAITPAHGDDYPLPSKTLKSSEGIFFSVVKAEGINRCVCAGVLSRTLGQLTKLQKACQYHLRFICITCKKETNTGYLRNTGENPELYKWGRGKKTGGRNYFPAPNEISKTVLNIRELKTPNISESLSSIWGLGLCFQAG